MPTIAATPAVTPSAPPSAPFTLTSTAFVDGGAIPSANTCDGADTSPPLSWTGVPAGTATFALIVDDPDAGGFIHWVLFDLGGAATSLGAAIPVLADGNPPQGRNSFGRVGYGGPCPPSGTHHYRFRLLALATRLSLSGGPTAGQVQAAASGHILGEAVLTGTYRRR